MSSIRENVKDAKRREIISYGAKPIYDGDPAGYDFQRATFILGLLKGIKRFMDRHGRSFDNLLVAQGSDKEFLFTSDGDPEITLYYSYNKYGFKTQLYIGWVKTNPREFAKLPPDEQDAILNRGKTLDVWSLWKGERSLTLMAHAFGKLSQTEVRDALNGKLGSSLRKHASTIPVNSGYLKEFGSFVKAMKEIGLAETKQLAKDMTDAFKHGAIKAILTDIKAYGVESTLVRKQLDILKSKGANWSELDAIERSIKASAAARKAKEVDESSDWHAMIENLKDRVRDALEKREYQQALIMMDNLWWNSDGGRVNLGIDLDEHKVGLIREMLQMIQSNETLIAHGAVICLQDTLRMDWPDLSIIRRSTDRELTKHAEPQDHIFEQEASTEYPYPASEILGRLDIGHPLGLYYGIQALRYDGVKDSIILGAMKPYDKRLADWLDPVLAAAKNHKDWVAQVVNLMMMGANWPHLKAMIEKHRDLIIRHLLQEYKTIMDSNDWIAVKLSNLGGKLNLIRQAGYDWPELGMIEKSIEAGHK